MFKKVLIKGHSTVIEKHEKSHSMSKYCVKKSHSILKNIIVLYVQRVIYRISIKKLSVVKILRYIYCKKISKGDSIVC